jgi:uncharacterized protein
MKPDSLCRRAAAAVLLAVSGCQVEITEQGVVELPGQKQLLSTPAAFGLPYQSLELKSAAGNVVYGWFIPADGAPATVLINHGSMFNRSLLFPHYLLLHKLGYHVLVYDYQGFGDSAGSTSLDTLLPDADAALKYLQDQSLPGTDRIVLFGISMGTLPTLAQAARSPERVLGIILEGSFTPESLPSWTYQPVGVIPAPDEFEGRDAPYAGLNPYNYISQIALPKLFVQSPDDPVTPISGARQLYALAIEPKQFIELEGGHTLAAIVDPNYPGYLKTFLDKVTAATAAPSVE